MTKWEYRIEHVPDWLGTTILKTLGDAGWELVTIENAVAYFRRPKAISIRIGPSESKVPSEAPSV